MVLTGRCSAVCACLTREVEGSGCIPRTFPRKWTSSSFFSLSFLYQRNKGSSLKPNRTQRLLRVTSPHDKSCSTEAKPSISRLFCYCCLYISLKVVLKLPFLDFSILFIITSFMAIKDFSYTLSLLIWQNQKSLLKLL